MNDQITVAGPGLTKGVFSGDRRIIAMGVLTTENGQLRAKRVM